MLQRILCWFGFLLLAAASVGAAAAPVLERAHATEVRVVAPATATSVAELELDTPAGTLHLELEPATRFNAQAARFLPAGGARAYRGRVRGDASSWVRLTRVDGAWIGAIKTESALWLVDPAREHPALARQQQADPAGTLVFSLGDIAGLDRIDHGDRLVPQLPWPQQPPPVAAADVRATGASTSWHLGVTLVLDTEFQSHYGANAAGTAVGILNIVDGFYSAQVDTEVYLYALQLLPSGNAGMTATDAETLLNQFSLYIYQGGAPFHGLAHLLSGRQFDGTTAGIAWTGMPEPYYVTTLCNPGYVFPDGDVPGGTGVDQATFSPAGNGALLAHEMGHNHGAQHDGTGNSCGPGYIMQPMLNNQTEFSSCSIDYFNAYRSFQNPPCLTELPDLIFADGFD